MQIIIKDIFDIEREIYDIADLPVYNYKNESIDLSDNFSMHRLSVKEKINPADERYYILFYLSSERNKTPEDILINACTYTIEEITLFTSESQKDDYLLNKISITDQNKMVLIDMSESKDKISGSYLKINYDSDLRWYKNENSIYIIFSDYGEALNSYYIGQNCKIVLNSKMEIKGFIIDFDITGGHHVSIIRSTQRRTF